MQAAFRAVASEIYGKLCPFDRFNDITLARCFSALGILKVNDDTCSIRSIVESAPKLAEEIHNTVSAPTDWLVGVSVTKHGQALVSDHAYHSNCQRVEGNLACCINQCRLAGPLTTPESSASAEHTSRGPAAWCAQLQPWHACM